MWDIFVDFFFPRRQKRGLTLLELLLLIALIGIFALGVGCAYMNGRAPAGNPCAPDAAEIPAESPGDLICKIYPDPRDPHLLIKLAEAAYFAKYPQHADEALQYLGEVRQALAGEVVWEYVIGLVDNRFGNVMYAALEDELPAFRVPGMVSPRDKYFLLYAIGSYEGIARAGLPMRAQK